MLAATSLHRSLELWLQHAQLSEAANDKHSKTFISDFVSQGIQGTIPVICVETVDYFVTDGT